ncbi:MAG TPA: hypothetical protein VNT75_13750 [Symbiobacteriaceae bacterium]|nr:hypothetical protein [Symbiobacteriaceae bacterium]
MRALILLAFLLVGCAKVPPPPPPVVEPPTTFLLGELTGVDRMVIRAPGSSAQVEWRGQQAFVAASALTWAENLSEGATAECRSRFFVDVYAGERHLAAVEAGLEHCRTLITGEPPRKVKTGVLAPALLPIAMTFAPSIEWVMSQTFALEDGSTYRGLWNLSFQDRPLAAGVETELLWRVAQKEAPRRLSVAGVHESGARVEFRMLDDRRSQVTFPVAGLWRLDVASDGNLLANIVMRVEPSGSH